MKHINKFNENIVNDSTGLKNKASLQLLSARIEDIMRDIGRIDDEVIKGRLDAMNNQVKRIIERL